MTYSLFLSFLPYNHLEETKTLLLYSLCEVKHVFIIMNLVQILI